jgi:hypothetical protein
MGPTGTGKTSSIVTLIEAGIEVFFIGTEPGAVEVLIDAMQRRNLPMDKLHYHQMNVVAPGWAALEMNVKLVKELSFADLSKNSDIAKRQMTHLMDLLNLIRDYHDHRTGLRYGDATTWGPDRALVLDSCSGLNKMCREFTVGYSPTMAVGEWGVAMSLEENIIYKLVSDRNCFFVLIAHVDREVDELSGGTYITLSALGRKNAPQIVKFFSEVIYVKRDKDRFTWSTAETNVSTKNRALPISSQIEPSFVPIVDAHRRRLRQTEQKEVANVK